MDLRERRGRERQSSSSLSSSPSPRLFYGERERERHTGDILNKKSARKEDRQNQSTDQGKPSAEEEEEGQNATLDQRIVQKTAFI